MSTSVADVVRALTTSDADVAPALIRTSAVVKQDKAMAQAKALAPGEEAMRPMEPGEEQATAPGEGHLPVATAGGVAAGGVVAEDNP